MTRTQILALISGGIAATVLPACGAGSSDTAPATSGLTAAQSSAIDLLASAQVGITTPGLELGISYQGVALATRGFGRRSLLPNAPMLPTTTLPIASITKQFTAACILLLQEDGLLSIDDPLTKYVPEVTYGSAISLREMLVQISGLTRDLALLLDTPLFVAPTSVATYLTRLNAQPLDFPTGTKFEYSNTNSWLLGLIVERVSRTDYNSFLQRRIFSKAGMSSSYLASTRSDPAVALGYYPATEGRFPSAEIWDVSNTFSSGGIISTVADVLSWDHALTTGGLLNAASLQAMFAAPSLPNGAMSIYAMGWIIGTNVSWHNGKVSGFHAMNAIFPDGYAVVALGNVYEEDNATDQWQPEKLALAIHQVLNPALPASLEPLTPVPPIVD